MQLIHKLIPPAEEAVNNFARHLYYIDYRHRVGEWDKGTMDPYTKSDYIAYARGMITKMVNTGFTIIYNEEKSDVDGSISPEV